MNYSKKSEIRKIVASCLIAYLLFVLALYSFQRKIIFVPSKAAILETPNGLEGIYFQTADGLQICGWFAKAKSDKKPVIVYFHGNGGSLNDRAYRAETFVKNGFGLLMVSYRGYANSAGKPSESGFIEDGRAAMKFLHDKGISPENLILYGESIGSGVATQIAAENSNLKLLVLEAPFASILSMAQEKYWFVPVSLLLKDRFESIKFAPKITSPVLVMHAKRDPVVPFSQGERLFQSFNSPKKFIEIDADFHINLTPEFIIQKIDETLQ